MTVYLNSDAHYFESSIMMFGHICGLPYPDDS